MLNVLIVGFDSELNTTLAALLWHRSWNPRIHTATTTEQALSIYDDVKIDAIIIYSKPDMLPDVLYSQFMEHIKGHRLVVAASFDHNTNNRLVQLGCTHRVPGGDTTRAPSVLMAALPRSSVRRRKAA